MIVDKGNHSILDARFRFLMYSKWVIPGEARLNGGFEQIEGVDLYIHIHILYNYMCVCDMT